jgi:hypothetical protein
VDVGTNSEFYPAQHSVIGFYKPNGNCLLRGMNWALNIALKRLS